MLLSTMESYNGVAGTEVPWVPWVLGAWTARKAALGGLELKASGGIRRKAIHVHSHSPYGEQYDSSKKKKKLKAGLYMLKLSHFWA